MKKIFILFLIASNFIISSCSSDDNSSSNNGELIVNGVSYPLSKGYIVPNYSGDNLEYNSRRFYIVLSNGDVSMVNNEFVFGNNITQLIDFNLFSSTPYSGSVEQTSYPVFATHPNISYDDAFLDHSSINTEVVIQNNEYISSNRIGSDNLVGQVTISKTNQIYTVAFSFQNNENTISGTFTGKLSQLNYNYD